MNVPSGDFQRAFARALFADPAIDHSEVQRLANQPAFAVYRNTVMKACIDALEANFPTIVRLVGSVWFRAAAARYADQQAPGDARLLRYGDGFVDFLRGFEPAAELPYLPGVAQLDILWREAHAAPDARAIDPAWVSDHRSEQMADWVLRPHPAARWAWFDAQPVYSIWDGNRKNQEFNGELVWHGEGALLTRPDDTVIWHAISQAGCAFLDACAAGRTLAEAMADALAVEPKADLAALFAFLLNGGAFDCTCD